MAESMSFVARRPGTCQDCGASFPAGEVIRYDDRDEIVHVSCAPERAPREVCTECFLEKPCPCEDNQ